MTEAEKQLLARLPKEVRDLLILDEKYHELKADYNKLKAAFEEVIYGRFDAPDWRRKAGLTTPKQIKEK